MIDWAARVPKHASSGPSERFWPFRGCHGPGDRYPNQQLKTKSGHVWLFAGSQPHSLHSLKRFFWRRPIVIHHFGSKGASPALPSALPCTEAPRSHPRPKALDFRIGASTVSSGGAGPNPCSPTTNPEFPNHGTRRQWWGANPFRINLDTLSTE